MHRYDCTFDTHGKERTFPQLVPFTICKVNEVIHISYCTITSSIALPTSCLSTHRHFRPSHAVQRKWLGQHRSHWRSFPSDQTSFGKADLAGNPPFLKLCHFWRSWIDFLWIIDRQALSGLRQQAPSPVPYVALLPTRLHRRYVANISDKPRSSNISCCSGCGYIISANPRSNWVRNEFDSRVVLQEMKIMFVTKSSACVQRIF